MTTKKKICSAGLLYFYIAGTGEDSRMNVYPIDTFSNLPDGFYEKVSLLSEDFDDYSEGVEVFGVIGLPDRVDAVKQLLESGIKNNYERIIDGKEIHKSSKLLDDYGNSFFRLVQEYFCEKPDHYPVGYSFADNGWKIYYMHKGGEPYDQYAENAISVWTNAEHPTILGRQIMIKSFLFRDLVGRKVVGNIPNYEDNIWNVIFEGGITLPTGDGAHFTGEKLDPSMTEKFCVSQIDTILNNPSYAYGKIFFPTQLCAQWCKALLFTCAISDNEWDEFNLSGVISLFVSFLEKYICDTASAPPIISTEKYVKVFLKTIGDVRTFLQGEESVVVSKDIIHLLSSRYVYLPYLYDLVGTTKAPSAAKCSFDRKTLLELIASADVENANTKGKLWESVAEYVINNIHGLKVVGRRVRTAYQEIDLSVANQSLSDDLWQLGAYILVECKNWNKKADLAVIRNMAYISMMKGNSTALLFSANGVTSDAEKEIARLSAENIFILVITKDDLYELYSSEDCLNMLINKWQNIRNIGDEEFSI